MERPSHIDPADFVARVSPLLERRDLAGLLDLLKDNWSPAQIVALLSGPHQDARKIAALSLSLVGGNCCIEDLSRVLRDKDRVVNEMAEHALWSIWLRLGSCEANREVCRGTHALGRRDFDCAIQHFNRAIKHDPSFAEAYNQRAIAYYLTERYEESIKDCLRTVKRLPGHFGAWAGMGHCHAHLGRIDEAIEAYERALEINPHLDCLRQALRELKR
ncbi:MAG: tetratricopeptide repeat protein [Tepidisphaeraceae bacterium]